MVTDAQWLVAGGRPPPLRVLFSKGYNGFFFLESEESNILVQQFIDD